MCADSFCKSGLVPIGGSDGTSVSFVEDSQDWGGTVTLTIVGSGTSTAYAAVNVRRHAFYPGCDDTPNVSAQLNASTGQLEPTSHSFVNPLG